MLALRCGGVDATRTQPRAPAASLDPRVGRCPSCAAFTYDAAGLSEEELRRLVLDTEGRVLNRVVTRADGRVMSLDCGHGRPRSSLWRPLVAGGIGLMAGLLTALVVLPPRPPVDSTEVSWREDAREPVAEPPTPVVLAPSELAEPPVAAPPVVEPPVVVAPPVVVEPPVQDTSIAPPVVADRVLVPEKVAGSEAGPFSETWAEPVDVHLSNVTSPWNQVINGKIVAPPSVVAEVLGRQLAPVRECYRDVLKTDEHYRGTLTTTLVVNEGGFISNVSMPLMHNRTAHEGLQRCVEDALSGVRFNAWGAGSVTFKLVFAGRL